MEAVEIKTIRYPIEIFQKYKILCKNNKPLILNEFEFNRETPHLAAKLKLSNILNNPEIKANLNFLINRKNMSGHDEELYNQININLNKINDKNFNEISHEIMNLPYTKAKHIYRLAESILIKGIREHSYAEKYAKLSMSLIPCYIEINDNKVHYRTILLSICQDIFNELIFNPEYDVQIKKKHEYDRQISYESLELSGLNNFFGELNKVDILPNQIISFCFDKLVKCIEKGNAKDNKYEGIKNLVISSIKNIKEKDVKIYNDMKTKIQSLIDNNKFSDIKQKFHLMEALEFF